MSTTARFLLQVVLPTAIGSCVYVGWRSTDLLVFRWIEYFGLTAFVFRPTVVLPDWLLYSLPDGCWVFSATSWMLLIWNRWVPWTLIPVILAVSAEFGQLLGLVQGTYETLDILFYLLGFFLAGIRNEKTRMVIVCNSCDGDLGAGQH